MCCIPTWLRAKNQYGYDYSKVSEGLLSRERRQSKIPMDETLRGQDQFKAALLFPRSELEREVKIPLCL
ncbi:unnamed protein product [Larinioides sclopetarius]|uniref:Uncharacterized protein n=1 Tax=Larinioides sclopetarius TaxID=280406 RepID=A0AAV1ZTI9_9ARAC